MIKLDNEKTMNKIEHGVNFEKIKQDLLEILKSVENLIST